MSDQALKVYRFHGGKKQPKKAGAGDLWADDNGTFWESDGQGAWSLWGPRPSPRASLLDEAKHLVTGARNNQYGPPTQDFQRSADALTAMGYRKTTPTGESVNLESHDIAVVLAMVKISRITWTPSKRDSWTDLAGYAACGYECSLIEDGEVEK